ncbi:VOC family protein [Saccharopolyspora shandongensis]|uniref:VOC family protein n=1 Tax=Saccharopolyspora shandongensis TaxID=418495 RepID=UPI003F4D52EA
MACRITELVLDCADPQRLGTFWCEVLGYVELGWAGDDGRCPACRCGADGRRIVARAG